MAICLLSSYIVNYNVPGYLPTPRPPKTYREPVPGYLCGIFGHIV